MTALLLTFAAATALGTFAACGEAHEHTWGEWQISVTPTAVQTGLITRTCTEDSAHKESAILPALNSVDYTVVETEATCTLDGGVYYTLNDGTYLINGEHIVISILDGSKATGHNLTYVEAVAATCTTDGNTAYYHCDKCDGYFTDEAAANATTLADVTISALGHTLDEATYSDGKWYETCSVCGDVSTTEVTDTAQYTLLASDATSLAAAIATGTANIKLTADIEDTSTTYSVAENMTVTLDLNGHSITTTSSIAITVNSGATLTIDDSSANGTGVITGTNIAVKNVTGGTVIVNGGTLISTANRAVQNQGTLIVNGGTLTGSLYGIWQKNGTTTINDGTIKGETTALYTQESVATINGGMLTSTTGGCIWIFGNGTSLDTKLYIYGGTFQTTSTDYAAIQSNGSNSEGAYYGYVGIYIYGGTITATDLGLYLPAVNSETVISGTTESPVIISGKTGVEIRSGSLTINGNVTITATGEFSAASNGNGSTVTGAAIAVSQHTTNNDITVNISGGTFTGAYAIYEKDLQDPSVGGITVTVTGGTFSGTVSSDTVTSETGATTTTYALSISGGTFSTDVSSYVASGYACTQSDSVYVVAASN